MGTNESRRGVGRDGSLGHWVAALLGGAAMAVGFILLVGCGSTDGPEGGGIDDWAYVPSAAEADGMANSAGAAPPQSAPAPGPTAGGAADSNLGFSVGGAKGVENFRENIENGYLPLPTDLTYEGLFYDYYFDTGKTQPCTELFCPSYTQMMSTDPLSSTPERFLSVGLNSGMTTAMFQRKKLNVVVVLDISGSMGSPFSQYYYDRSKAQPGSGAIEEPPSDKTKMQIANEAIVAMLGHLEADDHFGMVLFESQAHLAKPLSQVGQTNMSAIEGHILQITQHGGTNMEAGYNKGTELFAQVAGADPAVYENRVIFLTDAMPNTGDTSEGSLLGMVAANASKKIYTTFIGVGVDFNTTLIEAITKVQGANYYAVHSEKKFKQRMDEEFDFMVTPLVFDLQLAFASAGFGIDEVYGSPEADQSTGVLLKVNTLFPSKVEDGQTKGGVIVLKLAQTGAGGDDAIDLTATYKDREEKAHSTKAPFTYDAQPDVAPNTGIRKAILLSRYVRLMKDWITDEGGLSASQPSSSDQPPSWERESIPLSVSAAYQSKIKTFLTHFKAEAAALGDTDLDRETKILERLASWK